MAVASLFKGIRKIFNDLVCDPKLASSPTLDAIMSKTTTNGLIIKDKALLLSLTKTKHITIMAKNT